MNSVLSETSYHFKEASVLHNPALSHFLTFCAGERTTRGKIVTLRPSLASSGPHVFIPLPLLHQMPPRMNCRHQVAVGSRRSLRLFREIYPNSGVPRNAPGGGDFSTYPRLLSDLSLSHYFYWASMVTSCCSQVHRLMCLWPAQGWGEKKEREGVTVPRKGWATKPAIRATSAVAFQNPS